ncbi:hypothetical protein POSPLADRAFT_1075346 [Postia placenta MAD-698-R-SB12]|uniref:Uncharacterized protein n=1 Tax=Postia placenta MAD-698-R-SB12 TaxID=670580 RepID=A0A1X6MTY7_9APHY|nr:hypothetical protein POSPLADRAFT_1075346 [Postia placenta MAD-698-R-SB12]OSX59835.1 hypothetical protein POSPLADRAFT_1075346 [Postia placenta MAD-698-R-SB12]
MSSSLSSATSTQASSVSSSTPSQTLGSENSGSGSSSPSSSLYLFTFLATLFLLLFVSAAIVLRSFILRRRFRRRVEEALAAGILLTPTAGAPGSRKRLEKPRLWDASLLPAHREEWAKVMPVAARLLNVATARTGNSDSPSVPAEPQLTPTLRQTALGVLQRPFARRRATASSTLPTSPLSLSMSQSAGSDAADDPLAQTSQVEITVLVSMPNPHRPMYSVDAANRPASTKGKGRSSSSYWDEEEDGVPDVVLGLARVQCKGLASPLEQ